SLSILALKFSRIYTNIGHQWLIRENLPQEKRLLQGVIQCDEIYIGGQNKFRHWNKKLKEVEIPTIKL
ncbi:MAG: hypothetical protein ACRC0X_04890, partial [Brevinema sp.]